MALVTFDYDDLLSKVTTILKNSSTLSYVPDSSIFYLVSPEFLFVSHYWPGISVVPGPVRYNLQGIDGAGQKYQDGTLTIWVVTKVLAYDNPQAPLAGYSAGSGATLDTQKGVLDILKDVESVLDESTLTSTITDIWIESLTEPRTLRIVDDDDAGVWGVTMGLTYRFQVDH